MVRVGLWCDGRGVEKPLETCVRQQLPSSLVPPSRKWDIFTLVPTRLTWEFLNIDALSSPTRRGVEKAAMNKDELLKENLIEALKQVHQYVVLGLGTSVSALALAVRTSATGEPGITVPGTFVAVDPRAARAVLLAVCCLAGMMAYYSADAANVIAQRLKTSPDLLEAVCTYPSFATSRYPGVRYIAALLPLVLSIIALVISGLHETPHTWTALWIGLVFIGSAYASLALELHHPIGTV